MMDPVETIVRWAGAGAVVIVLAAVLLGLWQGRHRARGRGVGPGRRIAALPFWVYLLMTIGYLGLCALLWRPLPVVLPGPARVAALVIGALLLFPGLALVLWARLTLGRSYGVSGSLGTQLYADHQLVTSGPFAFVRHPMYVGLLVAALGGILVYRTWTPVFVALNFIGFVFRARREEQALATEFGEAWSEYAQRVSAWVPRLHIRQNLLAIREKTLTLRTGRWRGIPWGPLVEITLILAWAIIVGRGYLDPDPASWPQGGEFPYTIQSHFVWTLLPRCGPCVFWNGFLDGGAPAFVELHAGLLHPVVVAGTLLFGVVNGAKITLLAALGMAGLAQWWIARVLRLGLVPRMWSALLVVVGGHLAGRMDSGVYAIVLSTAASSLVIAPALDVAMTGNRRATVALGITTALALLSGQGYLQVGLLLGFFPALALFLVDDRLRLRPVWKEFLLAAVLALLLAGVFLVPLVHFWPNMAKDLDPEFRSAQPLAYIPFNFLVNDTQFYLSQVLQMQPYPYLYVNFIGWVPILFALLAFRLVPRAQLRLLLCLLVAIGLVLLASSGLTFRALAAFPFLRDFATGVRNPSLIAGLAVPLILGLAAWGLELLLKTKWLQATAETTTGRPLAVGLAWLAMPILLPLSLLAAYRFAAPWLEIRTKPPGLVPIIRALQTPSAQWVRPPFGEHFWIPDALGAGLKITETWRTWHWKDRSNPPVRREATRQAVDTASPDYRGTIAGISLLDHPENEYASVDTGSQQFPCLATAVGGNINVDCNNSVSGMLTVQENTWSGWYAYMDGQPVLLEKGQWLNVPAPAGTHHFEFRYRPWDVWVGLGMTLLGLAGAIWLTFSGTRPGTSSSG